MTPFNFNKFNKFVTFPDLSNKFLFSSYSSVISPNIFDIYLKYIFNNRLIYSSIAIKALLMLNSISTKRCHVKSRMILVKFSKNRCISSIFLKLSLKELAPVLSFFMKKPTKIQIVSDSYIKESSYFIFPGFIKLLRFPSWERFVSLSYNQTNKRYQYFLLFYKTLYLD